MAHRIHPRNTPSGMLQRAMRFPWQLLVIIPLLGSLAVPTFLYMSRAGDKVIPAITQLFYKLSNPEIICHRNTTATVFYDLAPGGPSAIYRANRRFMR